MRLPKLLMGVFRKNALLYEFISHAAITFFSTLAIQITTFFILAISAIILPVADFARLSIIVAAVMMSSALFELGLNITSTKKYGDTHDEDYLRAAFAVRLVLVPLGFAAGGVAGIFGASDVGLGVGLGALLNIWNGMRAADQARQDYASFTRSSIAFALVRIVAGLLALLLFEAPVLVAIAVYAVPVVAAALSTSATLAKGSFSVPYSLFRESAQYAVYVYINAVAFIAIPYIPQFFISERLDIESTGTYGLILTFVGPVTLVVNSIYNVLLPKMLGNREIFEDLLWSLRGISVIFTIWVLMIVGSLILSYVMSIFYADKFPEIVPMFLIFFAGFSASTLIGIYTLSAHTQGVPQINMFVNVIRFLVLFVLIYVFGVSLFAIIAITISALLLGQLVVVGWLAHRRAFLI